jgi:F-type H+-transporting ATPase subunit b
VKITRRIGLGLALAGLLTVGVLHAQPRPQPGQPGQLAPGRPPPSGGVFHGGGLQAQPGGQPPVHVIPGQPGQAFPGQGLPGRPGQGPPGQRPNMPPGHPAVPTRPRTSGPPPEPEPASAGEGEFCPGHGPEDPPPAPNWWHGLLWVDNERAQKDDVFDQLLFRYENDKDHCDPKNLPPPYLAAVVNFGILALIVYRFGRKPLQEALVKRKQTIAGEIETATKLLEQAEERLTEYEEQYERINEKLAVYRAEHAAQSEAEQKHLLAEAEERRARMRRDAEFRIEQELKTARNELLREAVEGAVNAAEVLVKARVEARDQDRIADDYLRAIGPSLRARGAAAAPQGGAS